MPAARQPAGKLLDELQRLVGVAGRAENEHELALLPFGQFDLGL